MPSQGPLTFALHETSLDMARLLLCELSRGVVSFVSNLLQNYFSRFIQDYQSSPPFLFPKPSFLDDHFTSENLDFSIFSSVISTDRPVDRSKHAHALT